MARKGRVFALGARLEEGELGEAREAEVTGLALLGRGAELFGRRLGCAELVELAPRPARPLRDARVSEDDERDGDRSLGDRGPARLSFEREVSADARATLPIFGELDRLPRARSGGEAAQARDAARSVVVDRREERPPRGAEDGTRGREDLPHRSLVGRGVRRPRWTRAAEELLRRRDRDVLRSLEDDRGEVRLFEAHPSVAVEVRARDGGAAPGGAGERGEEAGRVVVVERLVAFRAAPGGGTIGRRGEEPAPIVRRDRPSRVAALVHERRERSAEALRHHRDDASSRGLLVERGAERADGEIVVSPQHDQIVRTVGLLEPVIGDVENEIASRRRRCSVRVGRERGEDGASIGGPRADDLVVAVTKDRRVRLAARPAEEPEREEELTTLGIGLLDLHVRGRIVAVREEGLLRCGRHAERGQRARSEREVSLVRDDVLLAVASAGEEHGAPRSTGADARRTGPRRRWGRRGRARDRCGGAASDEGRDAEDERNPPEHRDSLAARALPYPRAGGRGRASNVASTPPPHPSSRRPGPSSPPPSGRGGASLVVLAMLALPLCVLALAVAFVPAWRPWTAPPTVTRTAPHAAAPEAVVHGRVVDADGEPVEQARVALLGQAPTHYVLHETRTDASGAFAFAESRGVRVHVLAEHDERGVVLSAELVLDPAKPPPEVVLTLAPARAIRGHVTSEGKAVANASVMTDGPPWLPRKDTSGEDGAYQLARVPFVARTIRVVAAGFRAVTVPLARAGSTSEEQIDVQLVRESDVEGTVVDAEGQPIRASVLACEGKDAAHRTTSGSDGKFKLSRELASCPLVAVHDAYATSDPVTSVGDVVVLRLRAGGSISGVVVDEGGAPVVPCFVGVESFTPASGGEFSVRSGTSKTFNDPNGAFVIEKLAPGSYVLSYGGEGRSAARSASIDVGAGRPTTGVRLVLTRGGSVEGQVFDEQKRTPIAGARVSFESTTSTRGETVPPSTTDASGRYHLDGAPRGPFSIRVDRDGFNARIVAGLHVEPKALLVRDIGISPSGDGGSKLDFVGIGATFAQTRDGMALVAIFEGGPAERAGLQQGDLLRKIDGEPVEGLSVSDAVQRLRGDAGTTVRVAIQRSGEPHEFTVVRAAMSR